MADREQAHLPRGIELVRSTPELDVESMPPGLRRAHRLASGVWGVLRVLNGTVTFVFEDSGAATDIGPGAEKVIPPDVPHHIEVSDDVRFVLAFHREVDGSSG